MSYTLQLAQQHAQYLAELQGFTTGLAMSGAEGAEFPSWHQVQADFDAQLCAEPPKTGSRLRLLREIGVA